MAFISTSCSNLGNGSRPNSASDSYFEDYIKSKSDGLKVSSLQGINFITKTPFFRTDPLLYHIFENMVIFRPRNLYSRRSPRNQEYQKIINFYFIFYQKRSKSTIHKKSIYFYWS